jgi:RNA polymerase sigma-70 factor, ECF subfamily
LSETDERLMQKVARGDPQAFRILMGRWEGPAKRYAFRFFGDYQLAEDAAQEAFVRIYRSAARYEPTARFSTYFYTVLGNLCRDRLRSTRRRAARGETFQDADRMDELPGGAAWGRPDLEAEAAEERELVREAVAELPAKLMEALSLREFEGLTYQEIADVMGANLGEVKTWIHRGRKKLGGRLARLLTPREETR